MKIEINKEGDLSVDGIEKLCPFQQENVRCGQWYALFSAKTVKEIKTVLSSTVAKVTLCRREYSCSLRNFTDESPKQEGAD